MPRLNLRDDETGEDSTRMEGGDQSEQMPPTLRDMGDDGGGGKGRSILIQIVLALVALAAIVFALNYFGVVNLWGKKTPAVTEAFPEPELAPAPEQGGGEQPPAVEGGETPSVVPAPETSTPSTPAGQPKKQPAHGSQPIPGGTGQFTVQVSSWETREKADAEAAGLAAKGLAAFVEEGMVEGEMWYRVRVGRFATEVEAAREAERLAGTIGGEPYAARTYLR